MKNKIATSRLFRVQGGKFPLRSRSSIKVNENNHTINCPFEKSVYVGNLEHMIHFIENRLPIKQEKEDLEKYDVHIIQMYLPYWVPYLIEKYSVEQFNSSGINYPKLVDKTVPGNSFQLSKSWSKLLEASCLYATDTQIKSREDIFKLALYQEEIDNNRELDWGRISSLIHDCNISQEDVTKLMSIWGASIIGERGEK